MLRKILNLFRSNPLPSEKTLQEAALAAKHSNDIWELGHKEFVPLFLYDMRPEVRKPIDYAIEGGVAFTVDQTFSMWHHEGQPIVFQEKRVKGVPKLGSIFKGEPARIRGIALQVRPYQLYKLDALVQNMVQFERKRVTIDIPYHEVLYTGKDRLITTGEQHFKKIHAFMYLGLPSYWGDKMDGGYAFSKADLVNADKNNPRIRPFYTHHVKGNSG